MKSVLVAMMILSVTAAAAQTPRDIERQLAPIGRPASQDAAPSAVLPGGATGADLARLIWNGEAPAMHDQGQLAWTASPRSGFVADDLVRLRGATPSGQSYAIVRLASRGQTP